MKREFVNLFVSIAVFLIGTANIFAIGEKTLNIGAAFGWEAVESRISLREVSLVRPQPVLALAPQAVSGADTPDFLLSYKDGNPGYFYDKQGLWQVSASAGVEAADSTLVRSGGKAARFLSGTPGSAIGDGSLFIRPGRNSIFAPGQRAGDFTIEFWLFPLSLENGEQILHWSSSRPLNGGFVNQRIQVTVSKNRLLWEFVDFFSDPAEQKRMTLSLSGSRVIPKDWSHHLLRFDSGTGLLEYLVDGQLEALDYASSTRREGGEVSTPVMGSEGVMVLGARFSGLIDDFRIYGSFLDKPLISKFPREGRAQTRSLDLGSILSRVVKIEAFGGRTSMTGKNPVNSYNGNGNLKFADHSEIQLFFRVNNTPYLWENIPWIPIKPGEELPSGTMGRYIQLAADFYSSGNGEFSPYLDELQIIYKAADLPRPPAMISAVAEDGAVELSWRNSTSPNTGGYLVYFGFSEGEYFGNAVFESKGVKSPIDAGKLTSIRIEGLKNGTLYYFAVASYDNIFGEAGDFSREVAARPLQSILYGLSGPANR